MLDTKLKMEDGIQDQKEINIELSKKGVYLAELGDYKNTIKCFGKAKNPNSYSKKTWLNKGFVLDEIRDIPRVIDYYY